MLRHMNLKWPDDMEDAIELVNTSMQKLLIELFVPKATPPLSTPTWTDLMMPIMPAQIAFEMDDRSHTIINCPFLCGTSLSLRRSSLSLRRSSLSFRRSSLSFRWSAFPYVNCNLLWFNVVYIQMVVCVYQLRSCYTLPSKDIIGRCVCLNMDGLWLSHHQVLPVTTEL